MMGVENTVPGKQTSVTGETEPPSPKGRNLVAAHETNESSASKQKPIVNSGSDGKYPFISKANHMLGSIPAPPAFASEFPAKDAIIRLNSAAASSSSVHAGMIRIRDLSSSDNRVDWSIGKNGVVNLVFSVQLPQSNATSASLVPMGGWVSAKTGWVVMRGWFLFVFALFIGVSLVEKWGAMSLPSDDDFYIFGSEIALVEDNLFI